MSNLLLSILLEALIYEHKTETAIQKKNKKIKQDIPENAIAYHNAK